MRFFTLVELAVGAIAVFALDEVRCTHAPGMGSAGIGREISTAFSVAVERTRTQRPCEVNAPRRVESTRVGKDLRALSGCKSPTNVLVAMSRRHDYGGVGICGRGVLAARQIHSTSPSHKTRAGTLRAMASARDQNHKEAEM